MIPRTVSVAPMLDWTDRHCRYFHRQISKKTWLYTEMITTGALIYGDKERYLRYNDCEHPVALQLGGSEPNDLATCAKLGESYGYDEINLNCGCPSERVQKGAFGACLMKEVPLVKDCVKAMCDATSVEVTVKHRIGIDELTSYDFVRDFIGDIAEVGCKTFIVHARQAILKGLNAKENRQVPPLHYDVVYQLKKDFPNLTIILNGGISTLDETDEHLKHVDGVMIGRAAYHNPWLLSEVDARYFQETHTPTRREVLLKMMDYIRSEMAFAQKIGYPFKMHGICRHLLGLFAGQTGARRFRQILSDAKRLAENDPHILLEAIT